MLKLVAHPVANETRADGHHGLQHRQIVLPQGISRLHDIHDHIGKPQNGCNLDGAVQVNNVNVSAGLLVVLSRNVREFGRHPEGALLIIVEILGPCHTHPTLADAEVQQLINLRLIFQQDILTADTDVRRAPLHINGNI